MSSEELGIDLDTKKYTKEQWEAFKQAFPAVDDRTRARFLIARNGDVEKSTALLNGHLEWKAANWPVLKSTCEKEFAVGRCYVRGTDKEGHPLIIFHTRLHHPTERDLEELGRMVVFVFEQAIKLLPPNMNKVTVLLDRSNAHNGADFEFMKYFANIMQNNYPERLYRTIVYPTGFLFYGIWSIAQVFLDPVTREKVKMVMYLSGVQEYIADECIPSEMGGQSTYKFNPNDYTDPYPEDVIKAKLLLTNGTASGNISEKASGDKEENLQQS